MADTDALTDAEKIEAALRGAAHPLTIDSICLAAFGRVDERGRNTVRVNLHRLDGRGILIKHQQRYSRVPDQGQDPPAGLPGI